MTFENARIALRAFTRRRPFRPFLTELVSGDRFFVSHPEALGFRGQVLFHIDTTRHHRLMDSQSISQFLDIDTPSA